MNQMNHQVNPFDRRRFLTTTVGVVGGLAAAWSVGQAVPAAASADAKPAGATPHVVEGSNATVALLPGATVAVLLHVARRFHYEISPLRAGDLVSDPSGTALTILPKRFPTGACGGLFPYEEAILRDILADCQGVVRWGGDDRERPREGHFSIDANNSAVTRVAERFTSAGTAAGALPDPFQANRRAAATQLAQRQAATG
jgi:hypothetical protein